MRLSNILIGSDPEVMVSRPDGLIVPVTGMLGGSKDEPIIVPLGAVQEDNVNAEFNIDPAANEQEFITNLHSVMATLEGMLPEQYLLEVKSSHEFSRKQLKEAGDAVMHFGCDPDFNTHTRLKNNTPSPYTTLRTAGGHVHIGWSGDLSEDTKWSVGAMCDYLLGLWSVVHDNDDKRRSMYGAAGAVRLKGYGVEYRTLSNFWLKSEGLTRQVYKRAVKATENVRKLPQLAAIVSVDDLQDIINNGDVKAASKCLSVVEGVV